MEGRTATHGIYDPSTNTCLGERLSRQGVRDSLSNLESKMRSSALCLRNNPRGIPTVMNASRRLLVATSLLSSLAACSTGSDTARTESAVLATPAVPATTPPAATLPEKTLPASTPPTWQVSESGIGPLRAGMSIGEAVRASQGALAAGTETSRKECAYVAWRDGPPGVRVMTEGGQVVRFDVGSGTLATTSGARIGDSEKRIDSLYAGRVRVEPQKYGTGNNLVVTPRAAGDSAFRIVFETDGQTVTKYRAGKRPQVEYVEGCG